MRSRVPLIRLAALGLGLEAALAVTAQGTSDSPYSAYGFGDLLTTGQVTQALMGGTGVAYTEPFSVVLGNPASYASLLRPVFEAGVSARHTTFTSSAGTAERKDASFMGFSIGVPFGKGRWGMALGLTPFSDVGYQTTEERTFSGGQFKGSYTGSGGLDRAFFGLAHTLRQHKADSLGNVGTRVQFGANFNFIFGSVEQTRDALYPVSQGYNNTRSLSSLVLRSPNAEVGVLWQGDLTRKRTREDANWRYSIGVDAQLPVVFNARYNEQVNSYTLGATNVETFRDSIYATANDLRGTVELPWSIGIGAGVQNTHWMFTVEARSRDWSATRVDVPTYSLPAPLRATTTFATGVRFRPAYEGGLFQRTVYRAGFRTGDDYLEVRGRTLPRSAVTLGLSLPLNAAQTNSFLHLGGEFGQRGTTADGLLREQYAVLWVGLTLTPWKGERWFTPPRIQ